MSIMAWLRLAGSEARAYPAAHPVPYRTPAAIACSSIPSPVPSFVAVAMAFSFVLVKQVALRLILSAAVLLIVCFAGTSASFVAMSFPFVSTITLLPILFAVVLLVFFPAVSRAGHEAVRRVLDHSSPSADRSASRLVR
jgi:hypothetical protein